MNLNFLEIEDIVRQALMEDIGTGDITTALTVPSGAQCRAHIISRDEGIVCGLQVVAITFRMVAEMYAAGDIPIIRKIPPENRRLGKDTVFGWSEPTKISVRHMGPVQVRKPGQAAAQPPPVAKPKGLVFRPEFADGTSVEPDDVIAEISGPTAAILTAERTALNFLQRLSGIATRTARFADLIRDTEATIVDTRKTTPGLRVLEKYAVRIGGGQNHRFGLYDAVLIKDNHIRAAGGIRQAVAAAKSGAPHTMKVEVEADTLEQVQEALDAGADLILLDNMTPATLSKAVALCKGKAITEASGGVNEANIIQIAETGVDLISIGALTHSARALDISLEIAG